MIHPKNQPIPPSCLPFFDEAQYKNIIEVLCEEGQSHLFEHWGNPATAIEAKKAMLDSLVTFEKTYLGGIRAYLSNSRRLLKESFENTNPYEGMKIKKPHLIDLSKTDQRSMAFETLGLARSKHLAIVLVAGGMGERLGYEGPKISIPFELITETSYLEHYASFIQAIESRHKGSLIPFIIMTSDQTHAPTLRFLEDHAYFGLKKTQLHLIKQALVPALVDNKASIAQRGPYEIIFKPHGHGDVHQLLHKSGIAKKLAREGVSHLAFIQDTNAQVLNVLLSALGVSVKNGFVFNTICVPRIAGEAAGAIVTLQGQGKTLTINVEYNQLERLLQNTNRGDGEQVDALDHASFPGNTNAFIIELSRYVEILEESKGIIAEFVNPKYTDATKTTFKKPTRLETMMQDLPKSFEPKDKVGVSLFNRRWSFSANKNNPTEGTQKAQKGLPAETAASAEADFYWACREKLRYAGAEIAPSKTISELNIFFEKGPMVYLSPHFCLTLEEIKEKVQTLVLAANSALCLDGKDIQIEKLTLAPGAALILRTAPGVKIEVDDCHVSNKGFLWESSEALKNTSLLPPYIQIRGYRLKHQGVKILEITEPGSYRLHGNAILEKIQNPS